jgi:hypothetical protein
MLAYKAVADALAVLKGSAVEISDIKVIRTDEPLVTVLGMMIRTGPTPALSLARLTNNYINGILIQDALLYRLA